MIEFKSLSADSLTNGNCNKEIVFRMILSKGGKETKYGIRVVVTQNDDLKEEAYLVSRSLEALARKIRKEAGLPCSIVKGFEEVIPYEP